MSDLMIPGGMPMGVPMLTPEMKERMDQQTRRNARVAAINTVNFLVEKDVVKFLHDKDSDPNMASVREYLSLVNRVAKFIDDGVVGMS